MSDGKVTIETDLDTSGIKSGLGKAESMIKGAGASIGKAGSAIAGLGATAIKSSAVAIAGVSAAIAGLGANAIKYNASMEQYQTSFEVMTGSAEKSAELMARLKQIGAATPFEFTDLAKATQTLMAFGFTADEAVDQFQILGDISQGDANKLDTFSNALGKMQSSGKVTLESLNMMIEQGFNPLQVISDKTGESMSSLYDRVSKGTVTLDEIKGAMVTATSAGGQFYQSMDKQSQTLNGRISTLKDNFDQFTGSLFAGASSGAGSLVDTASQWIVQLQTAFTDGGADGLSVALGDVVGQAFQMVGDNLPDFLELADNVISSLTDSLADAMYNNTDSIGNIALALITALGNTLENVFFLGVMIVDNLITGISEHFPEIVQSLATNFDMMAEGIRVFLPSMLQTGAEVISYIVQGIQTNMTPLMAQGTTIVSNVMSSITSALPSLLTTGIQLILQFVSGISSALPTLVPQAFDMVLTLVDGIMDNLPSIISTGITLITNLIIGIINSLPKIAEKAPMIIAKLVTAIVGALPQLLQAGVSIMVALGNAIVKSIPYIIANIPKVITELVNGFIKFNDQYQSIGDNIIKGIGNGITSGWSWLIDQVSSLAKGLLTAAKDALGIHSPSKEFAWIGEMSAAGMVKGFDENDPLAQIKDTLVSGTQALSVGVDSYMSANVGGNLGGFAESIVDAIAGSNMTIKIGQREFGRVVRAVI